MDIFNQFLNDDQYWYSLENKKAFYINYWKDYQLGRFDVLINTLPKLCEASELDNRTLSEMAFISEDDIAALRRLINYTEEK